MRNEEFPLATHFGFRISDFEFSTPQTKTSDSVGFTVQPIQPHSRRAGRPGRDRRLTFRLTMAAGSYFLWAA